MVDEQRTLFERLAGMRAELLDLKQAKRAGLLMRCYTWTGDQMPPGKYMIHFVGEPKVEPIISLFYGQTRPTAYEATGSGVTYTQYFQMFGNAPADLTIISTSPIASVVGVQ